jgi:hypothetical protein
MITFTFAGDESGDVSFNFGKGASSFFVMAVIATLQPQALRQRLEGVRRELNLPAGYEFGFNAMGSSAVIRRKVFNTLRSSDFIAWAVIVDKTTLSDPFKVISRLDFYLYFVTELLETIPAEQREGATLILDEFGGEPDLPQKFRRFMKIRNIPRHFNRVLTKRSKSEPLIQVADLVAGAIFRRDSHSEAEAFDMIAGKLKGLIEYRLK